MRDEPVDLLSSTTVTFTTLLCASPQGLCYRRGGEGVGLDEDLLLRVTKLSDHGFGGAAVGRKIYLGGRTTSRAVGLGAQIRKKGTWREAKLPLSIAMVPLK